MVVGIAGLGLIGGSFAKAYKRSGHTVYAMDADASMQGFAELSGASDGPLGDDELARCELVIVALYPRAAVSFIERVAPLLNGACTVIDCCGTKRGVCEAGFEAAGRCGFTFVGGHPMAGTERSGFKHSRASMFIGASMIIVPPVFDDIAFLDRVKALLAPAGFARMTVTTAERHDAMIAFTSQMAHLASNAYIKSPTAREHKGFSAGSYKDLTRVAWLNETMWAELFLENRENMLGEIGQFIDALGEYKKAIENSDLVGLTALLAEGKRIKEEVDR